MYEPTPEKVREAFEGLFAAVPISRITAKMDKAKRRRKKKE